MTDTQPTPTPLIRFVLFCVCLALAGGILAGAHYLAIDKPHQDALRPPANHFFAPACYAAYDAETTKCYTRCNDGQNECYMDCQNVALCTMLRCDLAIESTPEVQESLVANHC